MNFMGTPRASGRCQFFPSSQIDPIRLHHLPFPPPRRESLRYYCCYICNHGSENSPQRPLDNSHRHARGFLRVIADPSYRSSLQGESISIYVCFDNPRMCPRGVGLTPAALDSWGPSSFRITSSLIRYSLFLLIDLLSYPQTRRKHTPRNPRTACASSRKKKRPHLLLATRSDLASKEFQLEELEDREECETSLRLNDDGTVTLGMTNGPPVASWEGSWSIIETASEEDRPFRMRLTRTYESGG